mmetsp:Transcript_4590/g.8270  ORF Transcript_4590/g.8270 Transcript_4590/m.8270 type:complete len:274 (-) Transcript_4590:56-877(-)
MRHGLAVDIWDYTQSVAITTPSASSVAWRSLFCDAIPVCGRMHQWRSMLIAASWIGSSASRGLPKCAAKKSINASTCSGLPEKLPPYNAFLFQPFGPMRKSANCGWLDNLISNSSAHLVAYAPGCIQTRHNDCRHGLIAARSDSGKADRSGENNRRTLAPGGPWMLKFGCLKHKSSCLTAPTRKAWSLSGHHQCSSFTIEPTNEGEAKSGRESRSCMALVEFMPCTRSRVMSSMRAVTEFLQRSRRMFSSCCTAPLTSPMATNTLDKRTCAAT